MLYMVATPIGNLADITLRALEVLRNCDIVAAEEPLVSKRLLAKYDIRKPLWRLHQHSTQAEIDKLLQAAHSQDIAVLSSAGTPNLADPGGKLVALAQQRGIRVLTIPGASALTAFAAICGVDLTHFHFVGFLPHKKGRQTILSRLARQENSWPIIFFERGSRLPKLVAELRTHFKDGELIVAKELTKLNETVHHLSLNDELNINEKGEFVLAFIPRTSK